MTKEELIQLANQCGIKGPAPARQGFKMYASPYRLQQFAAIVAAAEREACAQLALQGTGEAVQTRTLEILQLERNRIAKAIRERGTK